jgi:LPXTG-site transpeptidase (sortase) family protein
MTASQIPRFVSSLLIWTGMSALASVGAVMAYATINQRYQSWVFDNVVVARPLVPVDLTHGSSEPRHEPGLQVGDPVGRLEIPRLEMSVIVFHGTDDMTLNLGVGHVPGTPLPGAEGNVALAAHRDTFFRPLERIAPGDEIIFSSDKGRFEYVVEYTHVVGPENTYVMESRGYRELTLITCYPFYFIGAAPERFIVHARPARI